MILERNPATDPATVAAQASLSGVLKTRTFLLRDLERKGDLTNNSESRKGRIDLVETIKLEHITRLRKDLSLDAECPRSPLGIRRGGRSMRVISRRPRSKGLETVRKIDKPL